MARKKTPAPAGRPTPTGPSIVDAKVLVIAALVASPAAYRASQGLLSVDEALTRFFLVAVACAATAMVVRSLWTLLAGPIAPPATQQPADDDQAPPAAP